MQGQNMTYPFESGINFSDPSAVTVLRINNEASNIKLIEVFMLYVKNFDLKIIFEILT